VSLPSGLAEWQALADQWQRTAEEAVAGAEAALAEVDRLRWLIRGVLSVCQPTFPCPCCGRPGERHNAGCPWPALMAEAAKA
jgi:hypothetical protein